MSSVQVEELKKVNEKLDLLNSMLIGDISPDVAVRSRTRFKTHTISKASTIADASSPKAQDAVGVINIQEGNRFIISTDGNPNSVSFRIVFADGSISDEIEMIELNSLPGKYSSIRASVSKFS